MKERCLQSREEIELRFRTLFLHVLSVYDNVINKIVNTRGLRQEHVNECWFLLLHCNCLSPELLSPTHEVSSDAHATRWQRQSSSNSVAPLCRVPGVGRVLQGKNKEALLSS
jgi:hypothetical protein